MGSSCGTAGLPLREREEKSWDTVFEKIKVRGGGGLTWQKGREIRGGERGMGGDAETMFGGSLDVCPAGR